MQLIGVLCISEPTEEELREIHKDDPQQEQSLLDAESQKEEVKTVEEGLSTCQTLQRGKFWQIWLTLLCISMVNVFVSSFYTVYFY